VDGTAAYSRVAEGIAMKQYINPIITNYWIRYYTDEDHGICTLCGNSGVIHTEGVKSAAGVEVGRANYCICPNGQTIREQETQPKE
jgi:hypothetical protein